MDARTPHLAEHEYPPIAREGWPIVALFVVIGLGLTGGAWYLAPLAGVVVGALALVLCLWCLWFFRDPPRRVPADPDAVISPADGVVCAVDHAPPPPELGLDAALPWNRVSVFMNVFNVHVNRAPLAGRVVASHHHEGAFLNASLDKASSLNERHSIALEIEDGRRLGVVQVAGLVARRIVCRVRVGEALRRGERYGLIRFGSRVDVYLPEPSAPAVTIGQRTVAGETILARLAPAPAGEGVARESAHAVPSA